MPEYKITATSTKAEEIAALKKFASQCDPQSYLGGLFSSKLMHWVEVQIGNDFPADVMGMWAGTENELNTVRDQLVKAEAKAKGEQEFANLKIHTLSLDKDALKASVTAMKEDLASGQTKLAKVQWELAEYKKTIEHLTQIVGSAWIADQPIAATALKAVLQNLARRLEGEGNG